MLNENFIGLVIEWVGLLSPVLLGAASRKWKGSGINLVAEMNSGIINTTSRALKHYYTSLFSSKGNVLFYHNYFYSQQINTLFKIFLCANTH